MNKISPAQPAQQTPYDLLGGEAGVRALVDRFYEIMDMDPAAAGIRVMHGADLAPMRQKLFEFMSGWLGGPRLYARCIMSGHRPFAIGADERDQWLTCMRRAMDDVASAQVREMLDGPLATIADAFRNR